MRKWFVRLLWTMLLLAVLGSTVAFWAISEGKIGYMPPIEDLQNPISKYATQVFSDDGELLGTWSLNRENRVLVTYDQLSPSLVNALVATEDERFYTHSGIDFTALMRAVVKRGFMGRKSAGGGSTITQQLAKQLFSETAHSTIERLLQKPIEWVIAVKLERYYTKEEILTMYLNYFDFLHNAVGIKTAAATYFGKLPSELDICESATLVGLCKNPSYYNPRRYSERALSRRNVVLGQMLKEGYLSQHDFDSCRQEPIVLHFHEADHKEGSATYFRDFLRRYLMAQRPTRSNYPSWAGVKYFTDSLAWEEDPLYGWCNKNHKPDGSTYNIYTDGLKVFTTLDSRMQQYAEEACFEHVAMFLQPAFDRAGRSKRNAPYSSNLSAEEVKRILQRSVRQCERYREMKAAGKTQQEIETAFNTKVKMTVFTYQGDRDTMLTPLDSIRHYKSFLRTGFMSMEPQTGKVRAYVGGLNFSHFAYDMATEGRRQVGSTIKPYLYSLAMENGDSPCDLAPNVQETYMVGGHPWTPRNGSQARYGEMVTLKWGLQQSNNWISAYLMNRWSYNGVAFLEHLRRFGIRNPEIQPTMSLCLGVCDITVSEMVSAYTAFVNHGIRTAPLYVSRIEDNEGNVIARFQPRMDEALSEESAHKMVVMLRGVVDGGTGSRLRFKYGITAPMGGKTGTTNNNSDAWFMAITPQLVSGCWVGGDDRDIHFDTMTLGQGAAMALPVYALFIQKVYADKRLGISPEANFDLPPGFDPCAGVDEDGGGEDEDGDAVNPEDQLVD